MAGRKTGLYNEKYLSSFQYLIVLNLLRQKLTETANNPPISLYSNVPKKSLSTDDTSIDHRDIDKVLSELAGMIGRWHLFKRYLSHALKVFSFM